MSTTTTTMTTAETVVRTLAGHTDGITTRELAKAAGLGQTTVQNALVDMEAAGTARRIPGAANGNRRAADVWRPVIVDSDPDDTATPDTGEAATADTGEAATDDANESAEVTTDGPTEAVTDDTDPATDDADPSGTPADQSDVSDTPTDVSDPADTGDPSGTPAEAPIPQEPVSAPPVALVVPVSAPPAPAAPGTLRQPDLKVLIMAGVLGSHPAGVSAHDAITESGLAVNVADTILLAMEVAGAARRLPPTADGVELWLRGDGDLATVDPAKAPTHVTCPTCGHTRPIRRAAAGSRRQATRTGQPAREINSDGSERLGKNDLRNRVEAFLRDLGAGHDVTAGTVARELGRSPGAVSNAMDKLDEAGVLVLTNEAPRMFALSDTAPTATAAVTALMRRPVVTDDTPADEAPAA